MTAALIDYSQFIGNASGTTAEVEAATKALRTTPKPEDYGGLGGGVYSTTALVAMDTALAFTGNPLFSFRWSGKQSIARIRKVTLSLGSIAAGTAGVYTFQLFAARNFISQYNIQTPTAINVTSGVLSVLAVSPLRSTMSRPTSGMSNWTTAVSGTSILADMDIVYISTQSDGTGGSPGMGGATVSLDTRPLASVSVSRAAVAGRPVLQSYNIWDVAEGDQPLDLSSQEGFVISLTSPVTGGVSLDASKLAVTTTFSEVPLTAL